VPAEPKLKQTSIFDKPHIKPPSSKVSSGAAAAATSAATPSPSSGLQLSLHQSAAVLHMPRVSEEVFQHGLVQLRSQDGQPLGELEPYALKWNASDITELSTQLLAPSQTAGFGALTSSLELAKITLEKADEVAKVII